VDWELWRAINALLSESKPCFSKLLLTESIIR
jgi:hypothetical protein